MRLSYALLGLVLASCSHPQGASLVVEPLTSAIPPDGTLHETIGIETLGGVFTPILAKGCALPCLASHTFSTGEDGQGQILLHVLRGDAERASSARSLGTFQISGIAPMPRGEASILVEFKADQGGITITARDGHGSSRLSLTRVAP